MQYKKHPSARERNYKWGDNSRKEGSLERRFMRPNV